MYGLIGFTMFIAFLITSNTTSAIIASIFAVADAIVYVGKSMNKFTEVYNKNRE